MSELFKTLNNIPVDFDDYQETKLTDLEKKQIKKRVTKKLKTRKPGSTKRMIAVAAVLAVLAFGFVGIAHNPSAVANIPLIGASLEKYIDSSRKSLEDYKVVIGKTVEDKGIEIGLNEVMLDNGRLVISSTFRSSTVDLERVSMSPTVYINGKKVLIGMHGSMKKIDDSTCISYKSVDLEGINIDKVLNIKISYNDMYYTDTGKPVGGNWDSFEFAVSGEKLMTETRTVKINKKLVFADGQEITVRDLVISPFSTTLNYSSVNGQEHISFEIEDQNGNRLRPNRARVLSKNSYNRFEEKSMENAAKLTIIPVRMNVKSGTFEAFEDKAFEVKIDTRD